MLCFASCCRRREMNDAFVGFHQIGTMKLSGCCRHRVSFLPQIYCHRMKLVQDLQNGSLDLFRINFSTLTLIPKIEDHCDEKFHAN
jgi:hypothetical protein